ncbi:MAG: DUF2183 domain-containing protein [Verrucomicrobiales bacterium]|nr:DUF2183 domain-containing protein [Verrucomicrobiales bacterium]
MSQKKIDIPKRLALAAESVYKFFHRGIAHLTGQMRKPMTAEIYYAFSHRLGISVKGRTLKIRQWRKPRPDDTRLRNLWQMLLLWATPERPNTRAVVRCEGFAEETRSDREGYFEVMLPLEANPDEPVTVELPDAYASRPKEVKAIKPSTGARCLIISDIDDTVLITHAARTLSMIGTTLFGNALTRQIFPGTPELYESLREGASTSETENNPFAYVTSSPYNLHGMLQLIFKENGIPNGAFFMTDWGLDHDKWLKRGHREHKLTSIRQTLEWFPDLPAILIGDSGQHDTHIYSEVAAEFPDRVAEILIRNVSDEKRIAELQTGIEMIRDRGIGFTFFKNSREAADVLFQSGWINEDQHHAVELAFAEDDNPPIKEILEPLERARDRVTESVKETVK